MKSTSLLKITTTESGNLLTMRSSDGEHDSKHIVLLFKKKKEKENILINACSSETHGSVRQVICQELIYLLKGTSKPHLQSNHRRQQFISRRALNNHQDPSKPSSGHTGRVYMDCQTTDWKVLLLPTFFLPEHAEQALQCLTLCPWNRFSVVWHLLQRFSRNLNKYITEYFSSVHF